jgi:hypothetical protein
MKAEVHIISEIVFICQKFILLAERPWHQDLATVGLVGKVGGLSWKANQPSIINILWMGHVVTKSEKKRLATTKKLQK